MCPDISSLFDTECSHRPPPSVLAPVPQQGGAGDDGTSILKTQKLHFKEGK